MKNSVLLVLALCCSLPLCAQSETFFNPINTISKVPQTPEVAAFEKFSGSVNMYNGTPTIGIPLYTLQGKEVSIPISLSYDASGIKVEQIASTVGLGWNLNFGGVVSRNVNGHPDDYIATTAHPLYKIADTDTREWLEYLMVKQVIHGDHDSLSQANRAYDTYYRYNQNEVDLQPDTFSFSVNGLSGTILLDYENPISAGKYTGYCLEDPYIKVTADISNGIFTITDTSGNIYTFSEKEITEHTISSEDGGQGGVDEYTNEYTTAWYLTKIESVNRLDKFEFVYDVYEWTDNETPNKLQQIEIKPLGICTSGNYQSSSIRDLGYNEYIKIHVVLKHIKYNDVEVVRASRDTRSDLPGMKRISKLEVFDRVYDATNPNPTPILQVDFDNGNYFGTGSGATQKRLKLDEVKLYRSDSTDAKRYKFTYQSPTLVPDRKSDAVDFWGYYNGQDGNDHRAPNPNLTGYSDIANWYPEVTGFTFSGTEQGVDRRPDFTKTKIGTLTDIVFPTGGKATYTYEEHFDRNDKIVGGLRIRKVSSQTNDPVTGENQTLDTYYFYAGMSELAPSSTPPALPSNIPTAQNYTSSGITQQDLIFSKEETVDPNQDCNDLKKYLTSFNRAVEVPFDITYSTVTQLRYNSDQTNGFEGCTITNFYNGVYDNASGLADDQRPFFNQNLHYGQVDTQEIYDSSLDLLEKTKNTYSTQTDTNANLPSKVGLIMTPNNEDIDTYGGAQGCYRIYFNGTDYTYENTYTQTLGSCPAGTGYQNIPGAQYSHYQDATSYGYEQYWTKLEKSESWRYEGSELQDTSVSYSYDSGDHNFTTKIEAKDSKNRITKTELFYPTEKDSLPDQPLGDNTELTRMKDRNQLSTPVYVKTSLQADSTSATYNVISEQRRIMDDFTPGTYASGAYMIMPSVIQVSRGGDDLEDRMEFHDYDDFGNLLEYSYPDGTHYINIWGYKGDYLLAEIKNASYSGMTATQTDPIEDIKTASNSENSEAEEADLLEDLNDLRDLTYFDDSFITVYVYDPGIGLKRTSDVREYTTFYYYDQHNRFKYATDEDGKVLSENEYSLRVNN